MSNLDKFLNSFQNEMHDEQNLRDSISPIVKEIETACRKIATSLQIIHQTADKNQIDACLKDCREIINNDVKLGFEKLAKLFQDNFDSICRYHDQWRFTTRHLTSHIALMVFLENGTFVTYEQTASFLNLETERGKGILLELEDYLMGLLWLASELSRLAVNSVTNGDYQRPLQISKFVAELSSGLRLLTFKNDNLRKKYDALKYDVKKIEEVVYDLSIRRLIDQTDHCQT